MSLEQVRNFLGIKELSRQNIELILQTASAMKDVIARDIKKVPALRGKAICTVFFENSTRTRTSFETAAKYLGADTVNLNIATSSIQKGETLKDTIKTLESMGFDIMVMRHYQSGGPALAAKHAQHMRIVNAGDGANEHPTQALLDMLTVQQHFGKLEHLKIVIVGDILHSRVARSNIYAWKKFGCEVRVVGPPTLMPAEIDQLGVQVFTDLAEALTDADVINVLRIQLERQKSGLFPSLSEYAQYFILNEQRPKRAADRAIILHPGPLNRGVEISSLVADSPQSKVTTQINNGVAVRMAVLFLMLGGKKDGFIA